MLPNRAFSSRINCMVLLVIAVAIFATCGPGGGGDDYSGQLASALDDILAERICAAVCEGIRTSTTVEIQMTGLSGDDDAVVSIQQLAKNCQCEIDFCNDMLFCPHPNFVPVLPDCECQPDSDRDGVPDGQDNCPESANAEQADEDGDGVGDECESFRLLGRLAEAGYSNVIEIDESEDVKTAVIMTEDETRGVVVISDSEGPEIILSLDFEDPEVLLQIMDPDGFVIASIFEDRAILPDGSTIDLTERTGSQVADACGLATIRTIIQLLSCAGLKPPGAPGAPPDLGGILLSAACKAACTLAAAPVPEPISKLICLACRVKPGALAVRNAFRTIQSCLCKPQIRVQAISQNGEEVACIDGTTLGSNMFSYTVDVTVDIFENVGYFCGELTFGSGRGTGPLVKNRFGARMNGPSGGWIAGQFTPTRQVEGAVTMSHTYTAPPMTFGHWDLEVTFEPFVGNKLKQTIPIDSIGCRAPGEFDGLCGCTCPSGQMPIAVPGRENLFECVCPDGSAPNFAGECCPEGLGPNSTGECCPEGQSMNVDGQCQVPGGGVDCPLCLPDCPPGVTNPAGTVVVLVPGACFVNGTIVLDCPPPSLPNFGPPVLCIWVGD